MRSSFFGFNVAQQGLYTARTAMDITNHNISNSETEGYSRQYGVQRALRPLSNNFRGMVGTGAEISSVGQYRDEYLDYKFWNINRDLGSYEVKYEALSQMEMIFNEPTDVGFTAYFDKVFQSLQDVAKNPSDTATRVNFVNSLESFTTYINDMDNRFEELQNEANFGVKTSVDQMNFISNQIAIINQQIGNLELTGDRANDLRDERMRLIDDLSKIVNIDVDVTQDVNGMETLDITINGQQLVHGPVSNELEVRPKSYISNPEDNVDMYDVYWKSGKRFYIENPNLSGQLKGYLEVRDGNNKDNFKGTITGGAGTTTVTMNPVSRHDLPPAGAITMEGLTIEYTSYTYNDTTGDMVFTLDPGTPAPATATQASMGVETDFKGIPYYVQQLNEFVRTIAREFNAIHEQGDSGSGLPLFTYEGYTGVPPLDVLNPSSYDVFTIENFRVNKEIVDDIDLLKTKYNAGDGESANDLVLDFIELRHDTEMFAKGVPDNYIQSVISEMGIDVKQITSFKEGQEQLSSLIINQRLSVSDVDLDEEAMNLVKFQQAYNMSAKIISVFDEIYDVTINQMGAR